MSTRPHARLTIASVPLLAAVLAARPAGGQPAPPAPSATDALLDPDVFSSKTEGFAFRPPAGGTKIRQLNSGEVVRFAYPDRAWTVILKSVLNSARLTLQTPPGADPTRTGLLDLSAAQLTDRATEPAVLVRKDVVPLGPVQAGLIEAHDRSGIDRVFVQIAIIPDKTSRYFVLQMVSPADDPKGSAADGAAGSAANREADARQMFQRMLATATVVDRRPFVEEQRRRLYNTRQLWVQIDRPRVEAALQPAVRFARVLRDGKDVGYLQVNARPERHQARDGVLVVARSHTEATVQPAPGAAAAAGGPGAVDLPGAAAAAAGPKFVQVDREAKFFVTFDRAHEDWSIVTRVDDKGGNDEVETGSSDVEVRRALDAELARNQVRVGSHDRQPPIIERETDVLRVDDYRGRLPVGKPVEERLDYRYLPQALAQVLPQVLPVDQPKQYLFAFYVSGERALLARYVDVGAERSVELDHQQVRAVPIADRIGADGTPTVHYVDRTTGQWLGTVGEDGKLVVLPTDESTLAGVWKGFHQLPDPPPPADPDLSTPRSPTARPPTPRPPAGRAAAPVDVPPGSLPPSLDAGPLQPRSPQSR